MSQEEVCLDCAPACDLPQASTPSANQPAPEQPEGRGEQAREEDVTDPKTFSPPSMITGPNIYIEYCDRVSAYINRCLDVTLRRLITLSRSVDGEHRDRLRCV